MTTYLDDDYCPDSRLEEKCLNCSKVWRDHYGWNCNSKVPTRKSMIAIDQQYLTQDMVDAGKTIAPARKRFTKDQINEMFEKGLDKLNNPKTSSKECPCGINRSNCDYHK